MVKVITYGTYDLFHRGHAKLLERAKALGDYLIVGVTSDGFDKTRGKINVKQSLMERIEAVRSTGIADEIIVEEYEGQKIDDIKRYDIDIFTVGSDWYGKFDYLEEYCNVVYLERTWGISSTELREKSVDLRIGIVGESAVINKFIRESQYVNGTNIVGICTDNYTMLEEKYKKIYITDNYEEFLARVDAIYIVSHPTKHYIQIKNAIERGIHVLCESPISMSRHECKELFLLAKENNCILMEAIKTAYSTAFHRLKLLIKGGCIGKVISVDSTCTSLQKIECIDKKQMTNTWNSLCAWGPTALLPIFQILGTDYLEKHMVSKMSSQEFFDEFTKVDFLYKNAVASLKVGKCVKSEGELIVSGTEGYIYVPAPWWKTDYFEVRYEQAENNRRYFYQLDGEGIRYQIIAFIKSIETGRKNTYIEEEISTAIAKVIEDFYDTNTLKIII